MKEEEAVWLKARIPQWCGTAHKKKERGKWLDGIVKEFSTTFGITEGSQNLLRHVSLLYYPRSDTQADTNLNTADKALVLQPWRRKGGSTASRPSANHRPLFQATSQARPPHIVSSIRMPVLSEGFPCLRGDTQGVETLPGG